MKRALRKKKVHRPGVKRAILAAVAAVLGVAASTAAAGRDLAGSAHPPLGRFEGSWLYFDTEQATMKPESKPTLVEIATRLKKTKDLDVVIAPSGGGCR